MKPKLTRFRLFDKLFNCFIFCWWAALSLYDPSRNPAATSLAHMVSLGRLMVQCYILGSLIFVFILLVLELKILTL